MSALDLRALALERGDAGSREAFQELVRRLVKLRHPGVRSLDDRSGDWGIDAFLGELDEGVIAVWQAKYFTGGVGASQQGQIRDSLAQLLAKADANGLAVSAWTLCIACRMSAAEAQWWDGYKRRQQRATGVVIELWDADTVTDLLRSPDAATVRAEFFRGTGVVPARPIEEIPDPAALEGALFLAQLRAAGVLEVDAAKKAFFNAEALAREVVAKGVEGEVRELRELSSDVHQMWEIHFNALFGPTEDEVIPAMYPAVMSEIQRRTWTLSHLPAGLVHRLGAMHQVVEQARAGWIRSWREVARRHGA